MRVQEPTDLASCWLHYLRVFALQTPLGLPVKITISVSALDGEELAVAWRLKPYDVVDARGRPAKQIETEDHLIAVEWLVPKDEPNHMSGPSTWGMSPELPKRQV